jgi:hypothetical protein
MKSHMITGGEGIHLNVVEAGRRAPMSPREGQKFARKPTRKERPNVS